MPYEFEEILSTIRMTQVEHFDIRTVTLGINLRDCADRDVNVICQKFMIRLRELQKIMFRLLKRLNKDLELQLLTKGLLSHLSLFHLII